MCHIFSPGHGAGNQTLQTKSDMVNKILETPKPTDGKQLRSLLRLIGYYRKFIPNLVAISVPLTDVTKKDQPNQLKWSEAQGRAFEPLESHIVNPPM